MLDLLVCHGTALALDSGLDANRFAIFERLNRGRIDCRLGAGADGGFGRKANDFKNSSKIGVCGPN